MNKTEILNELLQENPEISKEKIEEILIILLKNNPKVEINKNFKKKLKTRLLDIWNYEKKTFFQKYFKFFIPVFSTISIFVIFSFFYFDSLNNFKNFSEKNLMKNVEFKWEDFWKNDFENIEILKTNLDINKKIEKSSSKLERSFEIQNIEKNLEIKDSYQNTKSLEYIDKENIILKNLPLEKKENFKKECLEKWFEFFEENWKYFCNIEKNKICEQKDFEKWRCEYLK